jgi:hypothetical protein
MDWRETSSILHFMSYFIKTTEVITVGNTHTRYGSVHTNRFECGYGKFLFAQARTLHQSDRCV